MLKITNIEQQKRNRSRFSIYLDGSFAFGVAEDVIMRHREKLKIGSQIDAKFIDEVLNAEEMQKTFDSAVTLLSYRLRSEKELINRLRQKGFEENRIAKTIAKLKSYGYINDESFARSLAKDKQNIKKLGFRGVKYELKQKGVNQDIIQEIENDLYDEERELEQAIFLCEKKLRVLGENLESPKIKQKMLQFLIRKGYSFEIAKAAISSALKGSSRANKD
ncbi:RecX family transcriptional regulator (plasmid) [Paenibacillus thiaminolyticus]|uniref:RecX family transcriptional regulator n=1 Tax=Paenibacillus thiaminolyticus TaxID=49283 RepID=UPI00232AB431|nr:RecX family transcriptional regulator [Paenibacillus thiaminolyticus]WCF11663.1 RecX family transcriptional regulator [Paenibacillus thiaminolyticus]